MRYEFFKLLNDSFDKESDQNKSIFKSVNMAQF